MCLTFKMYFCRMFQDAEVIERLNESGELRRILKPYKVITLNILTVIHVKSSIKPLFLLHGIFMRHGEL